MGGENPQGVVPAQEIVAHQVCIQMPKGVMTVKTLPWDTSAIIAPVRLQYSMCGAQYA